MSVPMLFSELLSQEGTRSVISFATEDMYLKQMDITSNEVCRIAKNGFTKVYVPLEYTFKLAWCETIVF